MVFFLKKDYNCRMKKIYAYIHTHWDREWYREFEEFRLRFIEVFDDILDKLKRNELPEFYLDGQISAVEDYLEIYPEKLQVVKHFIEQKKLFVGPFFCSADEFLTSGESLLRNLSLGLKKSKELGNKEFIAYLSDTFGHCASMPEILRAANIDKAVLWRGLGRNNADLLWNDIKTTYLIQGYFNDFLNADIPFDKKAAALKKYIDKIAAKSGDNILLPIGADHLKVADNLKNQIEKLNKIYSGEYEIILSNPFEYFKAVSDEEREPVFGEFLDNSLSFILQGVYSSRNDIKQANARCERKLVSAEIFNAVNSVFFGKKDRQKSLDYAYKMLIKNHAHDSIYGCSTDMVNKEVLTRYDKVEEIADGILKRCTRDLKSDKGITAINLSNTDFSGIVKIKTDKKLPSGLRPVVIGKTKGFPEDILSDANKIPVTEDYTDIFEYAVSLKNIASFSTKNITKNDIFDQKDVVVTKSSIENDKFLIEFKNNKINVTDKKNQKIYEDFIKITDVGDVGDSYNFAPVKDDKPVFAKIKSVKTQNKKIVAFADITFDIKIPEKSSDKRRSLISPRHKIEMRIELGTNADFAKINLNYQNHSKNHKLQLRFNFDDAVEKTVSEDLFRTVERSFDKDFDLNAQIPAPRGIELKTNAMPINRFVYTQGTGIITDGLHEIEADKNALAVTLLRATGVISNPKNPSRGTPAGPPLEVPDLQMIGDQKAMVAFSFVKNPSELYQICDEVFNPPILFFANIENRKFVEKDNDSVKIIVMKKSEKNELILRLVNYSDEKEVCTLKCLKKQLFETDLTEEKSVPSNGILYFNPREIKTVKFKF